MQQIDPTVRNRTTISVDGGNGNAQFHGGYLGTTEVVSTDSAVTWAPFPASIAAGSDLKLEISVTRFDRKNTGGNGWAGIEIERIGGSSIRAIDENLPSPEWGQFGDPRHVPSIVKVTITGDAVKAGRDRVPMVATKLWPVDKPQAEGDRFLLVARAEFLTVASVKATFQFIAQYVYRSAPDGKAPAAAAPQAASPPSQPNTEGTATLVRQPMPAPAPDPRIDEVPPNPGELVPIVDTVTPPPPPPARTMRWFTHAEGFYRVALPSGWTVTERQGGGARDFLTGSDDSPYALFSIRDHEEVGRRNVEKTMARLEAKQGVEATWRRTRRTTIVGVPALVISCFYGAEQPTYMLHLVTLFRGDQSFLLGVFHAANEPEEEQSTEGWRVLRTLEFLK
jgi:hypothetical protein